MKILRWFATIYCVYFGAMILMMMLFALSIEKGLLSEKYFNIIYEQNKEIFSSPNEIFKMLLFQEIDEENDNRKNPDISVLEKMDLQNDIITQNEISLAAKGIHGYISGYKDRLPKIQITIPVKDLLKGSSTFKNITDNSLEYAALLKTAPLCFDIIQEELAIERSTNRVRASTIDEILKNPEFNIKQISKKNIGHVVDMISQLPEGISVEGIDIIKAELVKKPETDSKNTNGVEDLPQDKFSKHIQANGKINIDLESLLNREKEPNTENTIEESSYSLLEKIMYNSSINLRGVRNRIEYFREFVKNIALIFLILIVPILALAAPKVNNFFNRLSACFISTGFLGYCLVVFINLILDYFIKILATQFGILNNFPIDKFILSLEEATSFHVQNIGLIYIVIGIILFVISKYYSSRKITFNAKIKEWLTKNIKNPDLLRTTIALLLISLSMFLSYREYHKLALKSGLETMTSIVANNEKSY